MSEDGKPHVETIQLDVVCPKQDFLTTGGISDAIKALERLDATAEAVRSKLKSLGGGSGAASISTTGEIKLNIPAASIHAALMAGEKIKLNLSGEDFAVSGSAAGAAAGGVGGAGAGGSGAGKTFSAPTSGSGRLLLEVTSEGPEGDQIRKRRYAAGNFDRSFREITYGKEGEEKGSTLYDKPAAEGASAVSASILAKKDELQQAILKGTESEVGARRLLAETIRAEVAASKELNDLQVARYGAMASKLDLSASGLAKRQGDRQMIRQFRDHLASQDAAQESAVEQASRSNKARSLMRARSQSKQDAAQEARETIVQDALHDVEIRSRRQRLQSTQFGPATPQRERERMDREADARHHRNMQLAHEDAARWLSGQPGHEGSVGKYSKTALGHEEKGADATNAATLANDRFNESTRLIGKNMLQNIKHVTTWAASVGVLYGSIRLLTRSLEENMEIGKQQAILSQIFKGTADQVQKLTSDVIELASANGQSASEAMKSATEFARIYKTQEEILTATNAALVQANVTGEEAAKTTEFLSAMTQVYHLRASELMGVVGQMASISQNYNVTNINLAKGLEAVAESAKVAGMNIGELLGLIAGGISGTQQSGTTIGNTIKTMLTQMSNPEIQQKLRTHGIDVTEGGFGLKDGGQMFREIVTQYERMNKAEKESLLFGVGGRQNSTRMASVLDNYIQGQMKAIEGQLNMNAAEQENAKIMDTLKAQTAGLVAEWDRFVKIQGDRGPMSVLTNLTEGFKNLLRVANSPSGSVLTTLLGGLGFAVGAKTLLTGYAATEGLAEGAKSTSIFVGTSRAIRGATSDLDLWYAATISAQRASLGYAGALVQASYGMNALGKASRGTLAVMAAMRSALPLIAAYLGVVAVNKAFRAFSGEDQLDALQQSQTQAGGRADAYRQQGSLYSTVSNILSDPNVSASEKARVLGQIAGSSGEASVSRSMLASGRGADVAAYYASRGSSAESVARIADQQQLQLLRDEKRMRMDRQAKAGWFDVGAGQTMSDLSLGLLGVDSDGSRKAAEGRIKEIDAKIRDIMEKNLQAVQEHGPGTAIQQIMEQSVASMPQMLGGGIAAQFGEFGTGGSPLAQHHRDIAEAQSQFEMWRDRNSAIQREIVGGARGARLQLLEKGRAAAEGGVTESGARLEDLSSPALEAQRQNQERLKAYQRFGQAEFAGFAVGMTPGEQMVEQQKQGVLRVYGGRDAGGRLVHGLLEQATAGGESGQAAASEALQIQLGLLGNIQNAREKIIELQREEVNLAMQARREFERSLLTSAPEQLLQKMAALTLTRGRGPNDRNPLSAGEFFSLGQGVRQDIMGLPGFTEGERMARRGRTALTRYFEPEGPQTAYDAGNQAVRGFGSLNYAGRVPSVPPSLIIPPEVLHSITMFGSELRLTIGAIRDFRTSLATHTAASTAPHNAQSGSHSQANMGQVSRAQEMSRVAAAAGILP